MLPIVLTISTLFSCHLAFGLLLSLNIPNVTDINDSSSLGESTTFGALVQEGINEMSRQVNGSRFWRASARPWGKKKVVDVKHQNLHIKTYFTSPSGSYYKETIYPRPIFSNPREYVSPSIADLPTEESYIDWATEVILPRGSGMTLQRAITNKARLFPQPFTKVVVKKIVHLDMFLQPYYLFELDDAAKSVIAVGAWRKDLYNLTNSYDPIPVKSDTS